MNHRKKKIIQRNESFEWMLATFTITTLEKHVMYA